MLWSSDADVPGEHYQQMLWQWAVAAYIVDPARLKLWMHSVLRRIEGRPFALVLLVVPSKLFLYLVVLFLCAAVVSRYRS